MIAYIGIAKIDESAIHHPIYSAQLGNGCFLYVTGSYSTRLNIAML
jgi:hypothetical protein